MKGAAQGYLLLEDGTVFRGRSVAAEGAAFGEAVFTTGMTGYQETVTDPSYAEQLVCFTAPMVGNYGVDEGRLESSAPHAQAVLMRRLGGEEWALWLAERGIVALDEIDTRSLTLRVREAGAMRGVAVADERSARRGRRARRRCARSRRWRAPRSSRRSRRPSRTSPRPKGASAWQWSTTASSARSCAASRRPARR